MSRLVRDEQDDEPDWWCGGCATWWPARYSHCRNCGTAKPKRDTQELLKEIAREHPREPNK